MNQSHLYIVRGGSASGKTTLTPLLAKLLPKPVALIEQDNWRFGVHLVGRTVQDIETDEHHFADKIMLHTLEEYLRLKKYTIIIEGAFAWNDPSFTNITVKQLIDLANKYGYKTTNLVLKADKNTLETRNKKRKYTVPEDEFEKIYTVIYNTIDESEHVIDSSKLSVDKTLELLKKQLDL